MKELLTFELRPGMLAHRIDGAFKDRLRLIVSVVEEPGHVVLCYLDVGGLHRGRRYPDHHLWFVM